MHPLPLPPRLLANLDHTPGKPSNHRVRKVSAATGIITTIAGTGTPGFSGDGYLAIDAQLNLPG